MTVATIPILLVISVEPPSCLGTLKYKVRHLVPMHVVALQNMFLSTDPIVCNNSGTLITPQKNVMTVEKEPVKLYCIFQGNLQTLGPSIASYWGVKPYGPTSNETFIMDNSTYPYFIGVYQNDECNFINQLTIQSAPLYNVSLTCGVAFNDITNSHTSYFSKFIYLVYS